MRTYAKTGQEFTEAGMAALPGASGLYYLNLDVDEGRQGNWRPALIRAGVIHGPGHFARKPCTRFTKPSTSSQNGRWPLFSKTASSEPGIALWIPQATDGATLKS